MRVERVDEREGMEGADERAHGKCAAWSRVRHGHVREGNECVTNERAVDEWRRRDAGEGGVDHWREEWAVGGVGPLEGGVDHGRLLVVLGLLC